MPIFLHKMQRQKLKPSSTQYSEWAQASEHTQNRSKLASQNAERHSKWHKFSEWYQFFCHYSLSYQRWILLTYFEEYYSSLACLHAVYYHPKDGVDFPLIAEECQMLLLLPLGGVQQNEEPLLMFVSLIVEVMGMQREREYRGELECAPRKKCSKKILGKTHS